MLCFVNVLEQTDEHEKNGWMAICVRTEISLSLRYKITKWIPTIINSKENSWIGQKRDRIMLGGMFQLGNTTKDRQIYFFSCIYIHSAIPNWLAAEFYIVLWIPFFPIFSHFKRKRRFFFRLRFATFPSFPSRKSDSFRLNW